MEDNKFPITDIKGLYVDVDQQEIGFTIIPQNKFLQARCDYSEGEHSEDIVFSDGDFLLINKGSWGNKYNLFDFCKDFTMSCNGDMEKKQVILAWLKKNFDIDPVAFNKMIEKIANDDSIVKAPF